MRAPLSMRFRRDLQFQKLKNKFRTVRHIFWQQRFSHQLELDEHSLVLTNQISKPLLVFRVSWTFRMSYSEVVNITRGTKFIWQGLPRACGKIMYEITILWTWPWPYIPIFERLLSSIQIWRIHSIIQYSWNNQGANKRRRIPSLLWQNHANVYLSGCFRYFWLPNWYGRRIFAKD